MAYEADSPIITSYVIFTRVRDKKKQEANMKKNW